MDRCGRSRLCRSGSAPRRGRRRSLRVRRRLQARAKAGRGRLRPSIHREGAEPRIVSANAARAGVAGKVRHRSRAPDLGPLGGTLSGPPQRRAPGAHVPFAARAALRSVHAISHRADGDPLCRERHLHRRAARPTARNALHTAARRSPPVHSGRRRRPLRHTESSVPRRWSPPSANCRPGADSRPRCERSSGSGRRSRRRA